MIRSKIVDEIYEWLLTLPSKADIRVYAQEISFGDEFHRELVKELLFRFRDDTKLISLGVPQATVAPEDIVAHIERVTTEGIIPAGLFGAMVEFACWPRFTQLLTVMQSMASTTTKNDYQAIADKTDRLLSTFENYENEGIHFSDEMKVAWEEYLSLLGYIPKVMFPVYTTHTSYAERLRLLLQVSQVVGVLSVSENQSEGEELLYATVHEQAGAGLLQALIESLATEKEDLQINQYFANVLQMGVITMLFTDEPVSTYIENLRKFVESLSPEYYHYFSEQARQFMSKNTVLDEILYPLDLEKLTEVTLSNRDKPEDVAAEKEELLIIVGEDIYPIASKIIDVFIELSKIQNSHA